MNGAFAWTVAACLWGQAPGPGWQAIHGKDAAGWQTFVSGLKNGMRPTQVNVHVAGGKPLFSGAAVQDGRLWAAKHNLTAAAYQTEFANQGKLGFVPASVCGYMVGKTVNYAAVWVQDVGAPYTARHGVVPKNWQAEFDAAAKRGDKANFVQGYMESGGHRFAAVFEPAGGAASLVRHDLDGAAYQKIFEVEIKTGGWRPTFLTAYPTGSGTRFAIVLSKTSTNAWHAKHGLTAAAFQKEFEQQGAKGMRVACVSGYPEAGGSKYAALWVKADTDLPVVGAAVPKLAAFDNAMLAAMRQNGVRAAALAVSRNGKTVFEHGYGYRDRARTKLADPGTPFRFASDIKPMTAAMVRMMYNEKKADGTALLQPNEKALAILGLSATAGGDKRLADITIDHLLTHRGGWSAVLSKYDPMFDSVAIAAAQGTASPAGKVAIAKFMMGKMLDFAPGATPTLPDGGGPYSNFGYSLLGQILEKRGGAAYPDLLQRRLGKPLGMATVKLGRSLPKNRDPAEPFYDSPVFAANVFAPTGMKVPSADGGWNLEAMDSHGGMIASAPDLARFLNAYGIGGQPRAAGAAGGGAHFGKLDGTFAIIRQLPSGVAYAALYNRRTEADKAMLAALDAVANGIASWP